MTNPMDQFRSIPMVRNSERSTFKTCQKQWDWAWNQGLELAMPQSDARWFGSCWHVVWAEFYTPPMNNGIRANGFTRGRDPHETWDEQMKGMFNTISVGDYFGEEEEYQWVNATELGHVMIDGQLAMWNGDPQFEVIWPEQRYRAKIPFNERQSKMPISHWVSLGLQSRAYIVEIVGTFDLPVRDHSRNGKIYVLDWKSAAQYDSVSAWLVKDDQVGTYVSVAQGYLRSHKLIAPTDVVAGGIWSYARKQHPPKDDVLDELGRKRNKPQKKHYIARLLGMSDVNPTLDNLTPEQNDVATDLMKLTIPALQAEANRRELTVMGDVSKQQPKPLFWRVDVDRNRHNRAQQLVRIADDAEQISMARAGIMAPTKNPGKHCSWCDFKELCDVDENGGDTKQYIKDVFRVQDKYADHRAGASNSKNKG